jgi:predicted nucleic acid-binding protein
VVLIDTNVLVFLLIRGEKTTEARALLEADNDWRSETFLLVEFTNVLATYLRSRELMREEARCLLSDAEKLMQARLMNVAHGEALEMANEYFVSAYDGRFLALAWRLKSPLVTEDAKLRRAAPKLTRSTAEALRAVAAR